MVKSMYFVISLFVMGSGVALAAQECLNTLCILGECQSRWSGCPGYIDCLSLSDCKKDGESKFIRPTGPTTVINGKTYYRNSTGGYQATPPNTSVTK